MIKLLDALIILAKLLSLGLGALVVYWLVLKITGHSPTTDQVVFSYLTLIVTLVVAMGGVLFKIVGEVRELKGAFLQHVKYYDERLARRK
jgi:hypothetical protein